MLEHNIKRPSCYARTPCYDNESITDLKALMVDFESQAEAGDDHERRYENKGPLGRNDSYSGRTMDGHFYGTDQGAFDVVFVEKGGTGIMEAQLGMMRV